MSFGSKKKTKMKNEFTPYDIALDMKGIGFDEDCLRSYSINDIDDDGGIIYKPQLQDFVDPNYIKAPLYQQAFRWFREKHGFNYLIREIVKGQYNFSFEKWERKSYASERFRTYEEAELACLRKLIEIVKENQCKKK